MPKQAEDTPDLSGTFTEVAILSVPAIAGVAAFSSLRLVPLGLWVLLSVGGIGSVIHRGRTTGGRLAISWPTPDSMADIVTSFIAYNAVLALGYGAAAVVIPFLGRQLYGVILGVGLSIMFLDHLHLLLFKISREIEGE